MIDYSEEFNELLMMQECFVQNSWMSREMCGQNSKTFETDITIGEKAGDAEQKFAFLRARRGRAIDEDLIIEPEPFASGAAKAYF